MRITSHVIGLTAAAAVIAALAPVGAQGPPPPAQGGPPPQGPPPGMVGAEMAIVDKFDKNGDNRLNLDERTAARAFLAEQAAASGRGRGGGRGGGSNTDPITPGARLTPADVKIYPASTPLYDLKTLRTLFFQFETDDWEKELMAFNNTDVEVPATLTVDGKTYKDVGVHFRGASSFFTVPEGRKHSMNVAVDFVHDQSVGGYRTLNLLNSHVDPTYLRTMLYLQAARAYMPAPKANYKRVVINGESWGVYVSAQQFNKEFINEWFKTTDGVRWKVPGSPGGRGGLEYLGDNSIDVYKRIYQLKSKDTPKAWADLVNLTKVLNQTPPEQLEAALAPILNVDGALRFLALEMALINGDGYWTRASDYSMYQDVKGRFHLIPHDANETYGPGRAGGPPRGGGPGGPGGPPPPPGGVQGVPPPPPPGGRGPVGGGAGNPELDPLLGLNDTGKPLRSKLLAVPALRDRYMKYVREIATTWLDWKHLQPLVTEYQALIAADVKADTHKLDTFELFGTGVDTLRTFAERRRAYLLSLK